MNKNTVTLSDLQDLARRMQRIAREEQPFWAVEFGETNSAGTGAVAAAIVKSLSLEELKATLGWK